MPSEIECMLEKIQFVAGYQVYSRTRRPLRPVHFLVCLVATYIFHSVNAKKVLHIPEKYCYDHIYIYIYIYIYIDIYIYIYIYIYT